jgi:hypothetical protein
VAQKTAPSSTQASQLLQQSLAALRGNTSLSDVTLSGSARRIAGSDDESGSVTYKVLSTGAARFDFSYPSGTVSEARSANSATPSGFWIGPDGRSHPAAQHNLWSDPSSFPAFAVARLYSSPSVVVTLVGQEMKNGRSVYHLSATEQFPQVSRSAAALLQHLAQIELFLDAATVLPVAIDFNTHPDNDALMDLPVEFQFSDYRAVSGAQVPFHIQRLLNNNLILDLQFQSVVTNSGISTSSLGLQ